MFNIQPINIEMFGNIKQFDINNIGIDKKGKYKRTKVQVRKKTLTVTEIFDSIERRFNKFKYAYYNKGVSSLDKERISFCHRTASLMLRKLKDFRKQLVKSNDPRLKPFDRRLKNAQKIVDTYGNYVDRLNKGQCAKIGFEKVGNNRK